MFKKEFRKTGGYFTVEASMIVPAAVILCVLLIDLCFFLYDCCVCTQDAYLLAFRGSLCCGEEEKGIRQSVTENDALKSKGKYINASDIDSRIDIGHRTVSAEVRGRVAATGWNFGAGWEAQRICPVDCIRKVRLVKKIKAMGMG